MLHKIGRFSIGMAIVLHSLAHAEDARVTVVASPNPIGVGEAMQLRISVESPLSTVVYQPTFEAPDFKIITPNPSYGAQTMEMWVNGQRSSSKASYFTFLLQPRKQGELVIRNIKVRVGADTLKSEDMRVKVTSASTKPMQPLTDEEEEDASNPASPNYWGGFVATNPTDSSAPKDIPSRFNSDFTVHASIDKKRAYVGEPIVVEYYIYDYGGVRETQIQKWPTFNGFWKDDLEIVSRLDGWEDVYLQDQEMRRLFIGRYALYALKPGKLPVDKLVVKGRYISNNFFNQRGFPNFQVRTGTHASQDLSVEILPLPEGKPSNFSGAVGQFSMKLEANKNTVPQNSAITFTLTLSGTGNFQAVDSIKLPLPQDFELYETNSSSRGSTPIGVRRDLSSQKTFTYVAIPRKTGKFEIPALNWSYFNPKSGKYESISTEALQVEVTDPVAGSPQSNTYLPSDSSTQAPAPKAELRYLKPSSVEPQPRQDQTARFIILGLLIVNSILAVRFFGLRRKSLYQFFKTVDPYVSARTALLRAKRSPGEAWLSEVEEATFIVLEVLLGTNPRGVARAEIELSWRTQGLPPSIFQEITRIQTELDAARFSATRDFSQNQNPQSKKEKLIRDTEKLLKGLPSPKTFNSDSKTI